MHDDRIFYGHYDSPIGRLQLFSNGEALVALYMAEHRHQQLFTRDCRQADALFVQAREQLAAYFAGELKRFDLPLCPKGTAFQQKVWAGLQQIPFGGTESYAALAARIGQPTASRAVGMANGRNPLSVIIPCHRVIGADGALTGYGGGLQRKQWLLQHEQAMA